MDVDHIIRWYEADVAQVDGDDSFSIPHQVSLRAHVQTTRRHLAGTMLRVKVFA